MQAQMMVASCDLVQKSKVEGFGDQRSARELISSSGESGRERYYMSQETKSAGMSMWLWSNKSRKLPGSGGDGQR